MKFGHLAITLCVALTAAACTMRHPRSRDAVRPTVPTVLQASDRIVRAGCLDCLLEAFRSLEQLHGSDSAREAATLQRIHLGVLIAARERELGLDDAGRLDRARELLATDASLPESTYQLIAIADLLPARVDGAVLDDASLRRRRAARSEREAHIAVLRADADRSALSAYLWLSYNCSYGNPDREKLQAWLDVVPAWRDAPLLAYRSATCGVLDLTALEHLLQAEPRFGELHYFMALATPPHAEMDLTVRRLDQALMWRPNWPAAVLSRARAQFDREAFDEALADFDRLLRLRPQSPEALLGRVQSLTHLTRYEEALRATDDILARGEWYIGDARFWRALNELQLGRLEPAWAEVELAAQLLVNAEVPKLAGIIAARRQELDLARQRFQESLRRNPKDCETAFHLGNVLSQQRSWTRAADAYRDTTTCLDVEERRLEEEMDALATGDASPDYRRRELARRDEQLAAGRQMRAGAWFNTAVGFFNLSRFDDARLAAERVQDDAFYGSRARALLTRLSRR